MNHPDAPSTELISEGLLRVGRWIGGLRYKSGWTFRAEEEDGSIVFAADMQVPDVRRAGGGVTIVTGRIRLGPMSVQNASAFQSCVYSLVTHLELHEIGECLTFDGERPFDPHAHRST